MIKNILAALALFVSFIVAQPTISLEEEYSAFNAEQHEVLQHAYDLGKPFNMGYTLAAIAWQESNAGLYVLNLQDPAAGVFQNNIESVMVRHMKKDSTLKDTPFQRSYLAQQLALNMDLSASEALAELEYWKTIHGAGNWVLIWQSYNGGFYTLKPGTSGYNTSLKYERKINARVRFLINNEVFEKK